MAKSKTLDQALSGIYNEETTTFTDMVKASGLNPTTDFVGRDLSWASFTEKDNLQLFNFSGSDLRGTGIEKAQIDATTILWRAKLDPDAAIVINEKISQYLQRPDIAGFIKDKVILGF